MHERGGGPMMANSNGAPPPPPPPRRQETNHHHYQQQQQQNNNNNNNNNNNINNNFGSSSSSSSAAAAAAAAYSSNNGNNSKSSFQNHQGISMDWSPEEQVMLEEGLLQYASESNIIRYAKIAVLLKNKTVRDVALRCRWMTKKENSKRRKEDLSLARRNKDKKVTMENATDPSATAPCLAMQPGFIPYAQGLTINNRDAAISYNGIGGPVGQLLQQNSQAFEQISTNLVAHQIPENIVLLHQTRDNIYKILDGLNDMGNIMKQMPPLSVKVNEELANSVLPASSRQR